MKPKLVIFGASVRAMVQSAINAGYVVEAYDLFADHDTRAACKIGGDRPGSASSITQIQSFDQISGLVSSRTSVDVGTKVEVAIICGGVAEHAGAVEAISQRFSVAGCSRKTIASLTNRQDRFDVYRASGCLVAPTFDQLPADANPTEWLWKPTLGSGGMTIRTARHCDLSDARASSDHVFQQRIRGESYSAVFVTSNAKTQMIGVTQQRVGDPRLTDSPFAYCGSIGPIQLPRSTKSTVTNLGIELASRFLLSGVFGVDFLVNENGEDGVWPVDVNARIPSSAEIFEQLDIESGRQPAFNSIEAHLGSGQWNALAAAPPSTAAIACGKAVVFNQSGQQLRVDGETLSRLLDLNKSGRCVSDIPNAGVTIDVNAPIVTVHATAKDTVAVEDQLFATVKKVQGCWI